MRVVRVNPDGSLLCFLNRVSICLCLFSAICISASPPSDPAMASETSPLLAGTPKKSAGIPYGQLALLCYARWIDGWFFFTIFPVCIAGLFRSSFQLTSPQYIARMIQDTGIPAEHVGYYSGIIEASYSLVEVCTLLSFWTGISDTWGRRPVMVICLAGLAVSGTLFGFSTHVWQMIACRALSGAFSGCVG